MLDFRPKDGAGLFISPDPRHVPPPSPPDSLTWMRRARHEGRIIKKCVGYWGSSACCAAPPLPLLTCSLCSSLPASLSWVALAVSNSCRPVLPRVFFHLWELFRFFVLFASWTLAPWWQLSNASYLFFPLQDMTRVHVEICVDTNCCVKNWSTALASPLFTLAILYKWHVCNIWHVD